MQVPLNIQFKNNSKAELRETLLAVLPEEGCALLIGEKAKCKRNIIYQISLIWPCKNIWEPNMNDFPELEKVPYPKKFAPSRKNHFFIDPNDQLAAQKWARKNNLLILGNAHSHTSNLSIPSSEDIAWTFSTSLMVIVTSDGVIRAWWVSNAPTKKIVEVPVKPDKQSS